eukprot:scaffold3577_cov63-Phaeocystis_antarctica.AAC.4
MGSVVIEQSCGEAPRGWSTTLQTSRAPVATTRASQGPMCISKRGMAGRASTRVKEKAAPTLLVGRHHSVRVRADQSKDGADDAGCCVVRRARSPAARAAVARYEDSRAQPPE